MSGNVFDIKYSISLYIVETIKLYTKKKVSKSSEIYYDLDIYGDDLYEIFEKLIDVYEISFRQIDLSKIGPGEGGGFIGAVVCRLGFRPYRSFRVEDLIDFVAQGLISA